MRRLSRCLRRTVAALGKLLRNALSADAGLWPDMGRRVSQHVDDIIADYSAVDFERLVSLLAWLNANPASGVSSSEYRWKGGYEVA